jgi:hypothetical protein
MCGACDSNGRCHKTIENLIGKLVWKIPLGRPRLKCEDNINTNFKGKRLDNVGWIQLKENIDRGSLTGFCEHGNETSCPINGRQFAQQPTDY